MEAIISYFSQPQNGILGIIVLVLGSVIVWQQRRIDSKDQQITALQEQIKDTIKEGGDKMLETVKEVVATQKDSVNAVTLLQRSFDSLTSGLQTLINGKGN